MKKRSYLSGALSVCFCFALLLFPLSGCHKQITESGSYSDGSYDELVDSAEPSDAEIGNLTGATDAETGIISGPGYDVDTSAINIVLVGNSLTYAGGIPMFLSHISTYSHINVNIIDLSKSGYSLRDHINIMNSGDYDLAFQKAQIVIFQEYGSTRLKTAANLKILMNRVNSKAKIYFLLTEFDISCDRESELSGMSGFTYIPSGYVLNNLLSKGYQYEQFHLAVDLHPNTLYGYIAALTIYSVLFQKPIDDIPYSDISESGQKNIYNPANQSKDDVIKEIKQVVKDTVTDIGIKQEEAKN